MNKLHVFLLLFVMSTTACSGDLTHVTLTVVDDVGNPVEGAKIGAGFLLSQGSNSSKGYTNSNGKFSAINMQQHGVSFRVTKEGYYRSGRRVNTGYGDVAITLRPIKSPVPMYAGKITLFSAGKVYGAWIGYDFRAGDFVIPYGKGVHSDFEFKREYEEIDFLNYDYELEIRFPNENDGLLGFYKHTHESKFNSDYQAPLLGYKNQWAFYSYRKTGKADDTNIDNNLNYYFRVNTELDTEGNVVAANYGKTHGNFPRIFYYFNPEVNNRSLEISENLIKRKRKPKYSFEAEQ